MRLPNPFDVFHTEFTAITTAPKRFIKSTIPNQFIAIYSHWEATYISLQRNFTTAKVPKTVEALGQWADGQLSVRCGCGSKNNLSFAQDTYIPISKLIFIRVCIYMFI